MKTVRRIRAIKTVDPLFDEGDVFVQFFDDHNRFYVEEVGCSSGAGLDIRLLEDHGGFSKYFEGIDPVEIKGTDRYERVAKNIGAEIASITEQVEALEVRKAELAEAIAVE